MSVEPSSAMLDRGFDAFISYRHVDGARVARWLRTQLRQYKLPRKLRTEGRARLDIYLDTTYARATTNFWTQTILPALERSRFLIVIATPACRTPGVDGAANWVEREVTAFPRGNNILVGKGVRVAKDGLSDSVWTRVSKSHIVDLQDAAHWWSRLVHGGRLRKQWLAIVATLYDIKDKEMDLLYRQDRRRRRWWQVVVSVVVIAAIGGAAWAHAAIRSARTELAVEHWEGIERSDVRDARYDLAEYAVARELEAGSVAPDLLTRYRAYRQRRTIRWRDQQSIAPDETTVAAASIDGRPCAIATTDSLVDLRCAGLPPQQTRCSSLGPVESCHGGIVVGCGDTVIAMGNGRPVRREMTGDVGAIACTKSDIRVAIATTPPVFPTLAAQTLEPRDASEPLPEKQRWDDPALCGTTGAYASAITGSSRHPMIVRADDSARPGSEFVLSPSDVATLTVRADDQCDRFLVTYSESFAYTPTENPVIDRMIYDWRTGREWRLPPNLRKVLLMSAVWATYLTNESALGFVQPTDAVRRDVQFKVVANHVADVAVVGASTTASLENGMLVVRAFGEPLARYPTHVSKPQRVRAGDGVIIVEGGSAIELWEPLASPAYARIPDPEALAQELRLTSDDTMR